jgi:hypothetical protein
LFVIESAGDHGHRALLRARRQRRRHCVAMPQGIGALGQRPHFANLLVGSEAAGGFLRELNVDMGLRELNVDMGLR